MSDQALIFELTRRNFGEAALLNSHKVPVIVEFMGMWSGPCIALEDRMVALAREFPGQFIFAKVDIDEQQELRTTYRIENVPTVIVFRDGEPARTETGELNSDECRTLLKDLGVFRASDALREQARTKHMAGDTGEAVVLLTQAIQQDPGNTRVAMDMVQIMIDTRRLDDAEGLFKRLPEADRKSETGLALQGQLTFATLAARTEGRAALMARLEQDADDHDARFDLALCEVAEHRFDAAMDALFHIQRQAPDFREGAARELIVALINMLAPSAPTEAAAYRQKLGAVLTG
ncbi:MAG: tetratricopeptide repeat protein [Gammaproteobacteria bacterium]